VVILMKARPRAFLLENVFGLAYRNHNAFWFKRLLSMFRRLGYHVDHRVLLAADYGVPQRRQRLFIVGSRDAEPVPMSGEPTPRSFAGAGQR
jgi:DNA (cytosine-5)-methyltransferase 1